MKGYVDEIMIFFVGVASIIVLARALFGRQVMAYLFTSEEGRGMKYKMLPPQSVRRRSHRTLVVGEYV